MELETITEIIENMLVSPDLNSLSPLQDKDAWKNQLKAVVNLIPGVGGALAQELQSIEDYKTNEFFRKFTIFIMELTDLGTDERDLFSREIEEKANDYSGNVLLGLVDRLDNINKGKILANLIKAKVSGDISIEDFFRLSSMTERIPYVDLINLPKYQFDYYDESGDTELLFATGVLIQTVIDANDNGKYRLSVLGQKLLEYGMGVKLDVERNVGTMFSLNTATTEDINRIFEEKMEKRRPRVEEETLILQ